MQRQKFNMTLEQAIDRLTTDHATMTKEGRGQLGNMDPDTAFEAGFNVCLQSLRSYTGPDPAADGRLNQTDLALGDQFASDDTKETR